jgi:hypothetical protein
MAAERARAFCGARAAEGDVWITASVDAAGRPAVRTITFAGALTLAAWLSAGGRMSAWATANAQLDADVA